MLCSFFQWQEHHFHYHGSEEGEGGRDEGGKKEREKGREAGREGKW